jgi:hypothetical protein
VTAQRARGKVSRMNDPLREIDDIVVHDAIDIFQTYIESAIGNLLDRDRSQALLQIENARRRAMENVKELDSEAVPMEQEARTLRLAIGLLEKTFDGCAKSIHPLTTTRG